MEVYDLTEGGSPLIISVPHAGIFVPESIKKHFSRTALALPDTDWHADRLYEDFVAANDVTLIKANYSRYVADLNRPPDDTPLYPGQTKVPLCPDKTFDGDDIYRDGTAPDDDEIAQRLQKYWQPYHDELDRQISRVFKRHGYAILYDAHSIRHAVPRLFEGDLSDLNLGTAGGVSCDRAIEQAAYSEMQKSPYSAVLNGRFIGGYITRHYGRPGQNIHALQMELAQKNYMDEQSFAYDETKAAQLKPVLERVLHAVTNNAGTGIKPEPV